MPNQATVTAPYGPGLATSAAVYANVKGINFDFDKKVVKITHGDPGTDSFFAYGTVATVSFSISQPNNTVTIST